MTGLSLPQFVLSSCFFCLLTSGIFDVRGVRPRKVFITDVSRFKMAVFLGGGRRSARFLFFYRKFDRRL